jgi:hypothetical protein
MLTIVPVQRTPPYQEPFFLNTLYSKIYGVNVKQIVVSRQPMLNLAI